MEWQYILVGGLEHEVYDFPYIGNVIIPTDWYFSEGLKPPTRYNDETIWLIDIMVCICRYENTYVSSYENIYTIKIIIDTIIRRIYGDIRMWIKNYIIIRYRYINQDVMM